MPSCFVPNCDTGHDNKKIELMRKQGKVPTLFRPPKCKLLLQDWSRRINRGDEGKVCSKKFRMLQPKNNKFEFKVLDKQMPKSAINLPDITNIGSLNKALKFANALHPCQGYDDSNHFVQKCKTVAEKNHKRCNACQKHFNSLKVMQTKKKKMEVYQKTVKNCKKRLHDQVYRLKRKVKQLKHTISSIKDQYARKSEKELDEKIGNLIPELQETVRACFQSGKANGPQGHRYTEKWLYDWNLLIDEMALAQGVKYDPSTLEVRGYVDLGRHTTPEQRNQLGDHGLVFMFQSYTGKWVQVLGSFLSKGCTNGDILAKLTTECIQLLENAGYKVDGVVTDGASWNHNMWKRFGVCVGKGRDMKSWSEHPADPTRKLFFFSDFPHLLKCLRNNLLDRDFFKTASGEVHLKHWNHLLHEDLKDEKNGCIRMCHKLTAKKINPESTDRMKVLWAFQLFSKTVGSAMQIFQEKERPGFEDMAATIEFIYKVIREFLNFLESWENITQNSPRRFLSHSTAKGFYMTINSTLGLMEYLTGSAVGMPHILTRKLNQDALEHFFGLVRGIGGCSTHPDPIKFAQLVRLLSLYSLVKPPRGSNITGGDMLNSFLTCDNKAETRKITGYIARRAKAWCSNCNECTKSLSTCTPRESTRFIELKNRGGLTYPSEILEDAVVYWEQSVQQTLKHHKLSADFIFLLAEQVRQDTAEGQQNCLRAIKLGCSDALAMVLFISSSPSSYICRIMSMRPADGSEVLESRFFLGRRASAARFSAEVTLPVSKGTGDVLSWNGLDVSQRHKDLDKLLGLIPG
ncbi:hypothetical protein B566_EDAN008540 [Ephemera danica]|nr:hypothetical protein B566_EDAN008540 [Ephemera danica]